MLLPLLLTAGVCGVTFGFCHPIPFDVIIWNWVRLVGQERTLLSVHDESDIAVLTGDLERISVQCPLQTPEGSAHLCSEPNW